MEGRQQDFVPRALTLSSRRRRKLNRNWLTKGYRFSGHDEFNAYRDRRREPSPARRWLQDGNVRFRDGDPEISAHRATLPGSSRRGQALVLHAVVSYNVWVPDDQTRWVQAGQVTETHQGREYVSRSKQDELRVTLVLARGSLESIPEDELKERIWLHVKERMQQSPGPNRELIEVDLQAVRGMTEDDPGYDRLDMIPTFASTRDWPECPFDTSRLIPAASLERLCATNRECFLVPAGAGVCVLECLEAAFKGAKWLPLRKSLGSGDRNVAAWLLGFADLAQAECEGVAAWRVVQLARATGFNVLLTDARGELDLESSYSFRHGPHPPVDETIAQRWREWFQNPANKLRPTTVAKCRALQRDASPLARRSARSHPARDSCDNDARNDNICTVVMRIANGHASLIVDKEQKRSVAKKFDTWRAGPRTPQHTRDEQSLEAALSAGCRPPTSRKVVASDADADASVEAGHITNIDVKAGALAQLHQSWGGGLAWDENQGPLQDGVTHVVDPPVEQWGSLCKSHPKLVIHVTKKSLEEVILQLVSTVGYLPTVLKGRYKSKGVVEGLGPASLTWITAFTLLDNTEPAKENRRFARVVATQGGPEEGPKVLALSMGVARLLGVKECDNPSLGVLMGEWFNLWHPGVDKSEYNAVTKKLIGQDNAWTPKAFNEAFLNPEDKEAPESQDYDLGKCYPTAAVRLGERGVSFPVFTAACFPEPWDPKRAWDPASRMLVPGRYLVRKLNERDYLPTRAGLVWMYHDVASWYVKSHDASTFQIEKMLLATGGHPADTVGKFLQHVFQVFGESKGKLCANTFVGTLALNRSRVVSRIELRSSQTEAAGLKTRWSRALGGAGRESPDVEIRPLRLTLGPDDVRQAWMVAQIKDLSELASHHPIHHMIIEEANLSVYLVAAKLTKQPVSDHAAVIAGLVSIHTDEVEVRTHVVRNLLRKDATYRKEYMELLSEQLPIDFGDGKVHNAVVSFKRGEFRDVPGDDGSAGSAGAVEEWKLQTEMRWGMRPSAGADLFGADLDIVDEWSRAPAARYRSIGEQLDVYNPSTDDVGEWLQERFNVETLEFVDRYGRARKTDCALTLATLGPTGSGCYLEGRAGSGKTYALKQLVAEAKGVGIRTLVLSHTNFAANNAGGATMSSCLGHCPDGVVDEAHVRWVAANFEMIVLDECFQSPVNHIWALYNLKVRLPWLRMLLVGDPNQCGPIEHAAYKRGLNVVCGELGRRITGSSLMVKFVGNMRFEPGDKIRELEEMILALDPDKGRLDVPATDEKFPSLCHEPTELLATTDSVIYLCQTNRIRRRINHMLQGPLERRHRSGDESVLFFPGATGAAEACYYSQDLYVCIGTVLVTRKGKPLAHQSASSPEPFTAETVEVVGWTWVKEEDVSQTVDGCNQSVEERGSLVVTLTSINRPGTVFNHKHENTFSQTYNPGYARTISSVQSATLRQKVVVVYPQSLTRDNLYVAVSRVTRIADLSFAYSMGAFRLDRKAARHEAKEKLAKRQTAAADRIYIGSRIATVDEIMESIRPPPGYDYEDLGLDLTWDHKRPRASFPTGTPACEINQLCNMQLLTREQNRKKSDQFSAAVPVRKPECRGQEGAPKAQGDTRPSKERRRHPLTLELGSGGN